MFSLYRLPCIFVSGIVIMIETRRYRKRALNFLCWYSVITGKAKDILEFRHYENANILLESYKNFEKLRFIS